MWDNEYYPETKDSWGKEVFTFRWSYANDYDTKTGSALCQLSKIYKSKAVAYELKMITEDMTTLQYKGYLEGSIEKLAR